MREGREGWGEEKDAHPKRRKGRGSAREKRPLVPSSLVLPRSEPALCPSLVPLLSLARTPLGPGRDEGGSREGQGRDFTHQKQVEKERRHNAYILIYERQDWSESLAQKLLDGEEGGRKDGKGEGEDSKGGKEGGGRVKKQQGTKKTLKIRGKGEVKGKTEGEQGEGGKTRKRSGSCDMPTSIEEARKKHLVGNQQLRRSRFFFFSPLPLSPSPSFLLPL
jgi:hypothetical protein